MKAPLIHAFPTVTEFTNDGDRLEHAPDGRVVMPGQTVTMTEPGMTLHEWYVGQVVQGLVANNAVMKTIEALASEASAAGMTRTDVIAGMADDIAAGLMRRRAKRNAGQLPPHRSEPGGGL